MRLFPPVALLLVVLVLALQPRGERFEPPAVADRVEKAALIAWLADWQQASEPKRAEKLAQGEKAAMERAEAMRTLLQHDPERALAEAFSPAEYAQLPPSMQALVEEPFSGTGGWFVESDCSPESRGEQHSVQINGRRWKTKAFGARLADVTRPQVALRGVRLGEWAAVHPDEADAASASVLSVGDSDALDGNEAGSPGTKSNGTRTINPWSEGLKKILFIAIDFPDKPGVTVTAQTMAERLSARGYQDYAEMSYGKLTLEAGYAPTTVRMPQPTTYYLPGNHILLHDDAVAALAATGFDVSGYTFRAVYFESFSMKDNFGSTIAGKGEIGGTRMWMQGPGNASYHVIMHEFGHNLGLSHASGWLATGTDPLGTGTHYEYGDPYDLMGGGSVPEGFFHPQGKVKLGWLDDAGAPTAATSGLYRIRRIDHPDATGARGLKIVRAAGGDHYWASYRRRYEGFPLLTRGMHLTREWPGRARSWMVDTTPNSSLGFRDAPVPLGKTYSDFSAGIHFTPVAQGGSGADEWLDVRVNLGAFAGNQSPVVSSISGPDSVAARTPVVFSVSATDPDGDPLHYHWNFNDGDVSPNAAAITKSFFTSGSYTLTLTVSDGKGRTATQTKAFTVTNSLLTWNERTSGTGSLNALATNGSVVLASSSSVILRSTDGTNWSPTYPPGGGNFNKMTWTGSHFIAVGGRPVSGVWTGVIYTSPTGQTWTQRYVGSAELNAVASNGSIAIAAGRSGAVVRSTDGGITWSAITSPANRFLFGAAYGAGKFMIVGYSSSFWRGDKIILTSADGLTWTDVTGAHTPGDTLYNTSFIDGRFWATGYSAVPAYSRDAGASWTSSNLMESYDTYGIAYGNGLFFANGVNFYGNSVDLLSPDGLRWITIPRAVNDSLYDVVFFNNTFIVVGLYGTILQTDPVPAAPPSYETWRQLAQASSDPAADSDGDGLADEFEYATGSDPRSATSRTRLTQSFDGSNHLLTLPWTQKRGDVLYQLEASTDLLNWSAADIVLTETASGLQATLPAPGPGAPRKFVRARLSVLQP